MFPAKFCVLMQMLRIFRGTKKDCIHWAIIVLIWSNLAVYVATTSGFIYVCVQASRSSSPTTADPYILTTSAINIASDFSILLLPVFAVWKLKIALKRKITISAVFGTGVL